MVKMLSFQHAVSHDLNGIFSNVHFCLVTIDLYLYVDEIESQVNGTQFPLGTFQQIGSVMLQSWSNT